MTVSHCQRFEIDLNSFKPARKVKLIEVKKSTVIEFGKQHLTWTAENWNKFMLSDFLCNSSFA